MEKTEEFKGENNETEENKEENIKNIFSDLLTDGNPIGNLLNKFIGEVKNIKSEDLTKFADDLSQKAKINLEEKLKTTLEKEGLNLDKLDDDELINFFLKLNCDKSSDGNVENDEIKIPTYKFKRSDMDDLLSRYKNIQIQRKIIKNRINILSEDQKKEFWARYYEIPTQADVDNKLNLMSEKIEDLILDSQIIRKKLNN